MIDPQTQEIIYNVTNAFWNGHVANEAFRDITRGKEIGHRIADFVDDRTTANLLRESALTAKFECDRKGRIRRLQKITALCRILMFSLSCKNHVQNSDC